MAKLGRPPTPIELKTWAYDKAVADTICDLVAEGQNLHVIGKLPDMPPRWRIYEWFKEEQTFADNYARAREDRADWRSARIDSVVAKLLNAEIDPGAARVVIDAEKWQAGKEKPKVYGDKIQQEHSGTIDIPDNRKGVIERLLERNKSGG